MTARSRITLAALLGLTLASCHSGNNAPTCSFNDPAQFLPTPAPNTENGSTWPKFRANVQNTGAVTNVTVSANPEVKAMFPAAPQPTPPGPFIASPALNSPALNNGNLAVYIGSTNHIVYKLNASDLSQDTSFNLVLSQAITSTAVVGARDNQDAVFVGAGDGFLYGVNATGGFQENYWPFPFASYVSASPTLSLTDGTVYVGAESGLFSGVCPNGIVRFSGSTTSIESSAAIGPDGSLYVGSSDRQLRAFQNDGPLKWSFAASAPIITAPVVEVQGSSTFVYTADLAGHVFKLNAIAGQPVAGFTFPSFTTPRVAPISSSPALANGHLYFGTDDGTLYAINTSDGSVAWTIPTGGAIVSSPAVAIGNDVVVVVGSKDGNLYVVVDEDSTMTPPYTAIALCNAALTGGACDGSVCSQPLCADNQPQQIESSPAIGQDGTIYIGTDGARVFALQ